MTGQAFRLAAMYQPSGSMAGSLRPLTRSAPFSPIIMAPALRFALSMVGMIEASMTGETN